MADPTAELARDAVAGSNGYDALLTQFTSPETPKGNGYSQLLTRFAGTSTPSGPPKTYDEILDGFLRPTPEQATGNRQQAPGLLPNASVPDASVEAVQPPPLQWPPTMATSAAQEAAGFTEPVGPSVKRSGLLARIGKSLLKPFTGDETPEQKMAGRVFAAQAELEARQHPYWKDLPTDEAKLHLLNVFRRRYKLPPVGAVPPPQTAGDVAGEQFGSWGALARKLPYAATLELGYDVVQVLRAASRMDAGKGTIADYELLTQLKEREAKESRGRTIGGQAVNIFGESVPYGLELATGGIPTRLAVKGAEKIAGKAISGVVGKAAGKIAAAASEKTLPRLALHAALQTAERGLPTWALKTGVDTLRRELPGYELRPGDDAALEYAMTAPPQPLLEALRDSAIDQGVEVVSEFTGASVGIIGGKISRITGKALGLGAEVPVARVVAIPAQKAVQWAGDLRILMAKEMLERFSDKYLTFQSAMAVLKSKAGYNGVIGEIGEERIGELMKAAAKEAIESGGGTTTLPAYQPPGLDQLTAEFLGFLVPMAGTAAGSALVPEITGKRRGSPGAQLQPAEAEIPPAGGDVPPGETPAGEQDISFGTAEERLARLRPVVSRETPPVVGAGLTPTSLTATEDILSGLEPKGEENAPETRIEPQGRVPEHRGVGAIGQGPEAGGRHRLEPSPQVEAPQGEIVPREQLRRIANSYEDAPDGSGRGEKGEVYDKWVQLAANSTARYQAPVGWSKPIVEHAEWSSYVEWIRETPEGDDLNIKVRFSNHPNRHPSRDGTENIEVDFTKNPTAEGIETQLRNAFAKLSPTEQPSPEASDRPELTTPGPPASPTTKQPWQMTNVEYARSQLPEDLRDRVKVFQPSFAAQHQVEIRAAVMRGDPVPDDVLAEYAGPGQASPSTLPEVIDQSNVEIGREQRIVDRLTWLLLRHREGRPPHPQEVAEFKKAYIWELRRALIKGGDTQALWPQNKATRKVYEDLTGRKLPAGLDATKKYLANNEAPYRDDAQLREALDQYVEAAKLPVPLLFDVEKKLPQRKVLQPKALQPSTLPIAPIGGIIKGETPHARTTKQPEARTEPERGPVPAPQDRRGGEGPPGGTGERSPELASGRAPQDLQPPSTVRDAFWGMSDVEKRRKQAKGELNEDEGLLFASRADLSDEQKARRDWLSDERRRAFLTGRKAVTEVAEPQPKTIKAFHGSDTPGLSPESLEVRDPGYDGSMGPGIYLGANRATAEYYGKHVTPVDVSLVDPLLIDPEELIYGNRKPRLTIHEGDSILMGEEQPAFDVFAKDGEKYEVDGPEALRGLGPWAKSKGFDGIVMRNMRPGGGGEEIVVFDPSSIRASKPPSGGPQADLAEQMKSVSTALAKLADATNAEAGKPAGEKGAKEPWQMTADEDALATATPTDLPKGTRQRAGKRLDREGEPTGPGFLPPGVLGWASTQIELPKKADKSLTSRLKKAGFTSDDTGTVWTGPLRQEHRFAVEEAVKAGKSVPTDVLMDYPDLAEKAGVELPKPKLDPESEEATALEKAATLGGASGISPLFGPRQESLLAEADIGSPETRNWYRKHWGRPLFGMGGMGIGAPEAKGIFGWWARFWDAAVKRMQNMSTPTRQEVMDTLAHLLWRHEWRQPRPTFWLFEQAKGAGVKAAAYSDNLNERINAHVDKVRKANIGKPWPADAWEVLRLTAKAVIEGGNRRPQNLPPDLRAVWDEHFADWVKRVPWGGLGPPSVDTLKAKLREIFAKHADAIEGDVGGAGVDELGFQGDTNRRSAYTFKESSADLARELKERLPKNLQRHVRVVKKGHQEYGGADGADVMSEIGTDAMADSIIRHAEISKPNAVGKVAQWARDDRNAAQLEPKERAAAKFYEQLTRYDEKTAIPVKDLNPGDSVRLAGDEYVATEKTPAGIILQGEYTIEVPKGRKVPVDAGSLKPVDDRAPTARQKNWQKQLARQEALGPPIRSKEEFEATLAQRMEDVEAKIEQLRSAPSAKENWDVLSATARDVLTGGPKTPDSLSLEQHRLWEQHFRDWVGGVLKQMADTPRAREQARVAQQQIDALWKRIDKVHQATIGHAMPAEGWDVYALTEHRVILDVARGKRPYEDISPVMREWLANGKELIDEKTDEILNTPFLLKMAESGGLENWAELVKMRRESGAMYLQSLYNYQRNKRHKMKHVLWAEFKSLGPRLAMGPFKAKRAVELGWIVRKADLTEHQFDSADAAKAFADKEIEENRARYGELVEERVKIIPPLNDEQVEWLGPVEDVRIIFGSTLSTMFKNVEFGKLFHVLNETEAIDAAAYEELPEEEKPHWELLPDTPRLGELAGKAVSKPTAYRLNEMDLVFSGFLANYWNALLNTFKSVVVLTSSTTWTNQVLGQTFPWMLAGINPLTHKAVFAEAFKRLAKGIADPTVKKLMGMNALKGGWDRNGVAGKAGEFISRPHGEVMGALIDLHGWARKVGKSLGNKYGFIDEVSIVASWIQNTEVLGLPEEIAREELQWFQNYSRLGNAARWLKVLPVGDPFAAFADQAVKITIKGMREHPGRILAYYGLPAVMHLMSRLMLGVTDDEMKILNTSRGRDPQGPFGWLQAWNDRYFQPILPWPRDKRGRVHTLDMRYLYWLGNELRVANGPGGVGIPHLLKQPLFGPLAELLPNVTQYSGRKIMERNDPAIKQIWDAAAHVAWNTLPIPKLASRSPFRIYEAATGRSGENVVQVILKEVFGLNILAQNANKTEAYRLVKKALGTGPAGQAGRLIAFYERYRGPKDTPITTAGLKASIAADQRRGGE